MEREGIPDYAAEAFYRYLIPENVFEISEVPKKEVRNRVVACDKVVHKLFDISKDVAAGGGAKNLFNDEVHLIAVSKRIGFVIE